MHITLSLNESVHENAGHYFEKSKKLRKKVEGAHESIARLRQQLEQLEKKSKQLAEKQAAVATKAPQRPLQWFEKFRWFRSSEGFLCIGGRDASTNEIIVRKHTAENDLVFHTQMAGSPFFTIKTEGKVPGEATRAEAAEATGSFSRAWRSKIAAMEVFWVRPDQLSKTPESGEFLAKGAFIVRGKRNTSTVVLGLAVGMTKEGLVMCGPFGAIRTHCEKTVRIVPGDERPSDAAKAIAKRIGGTIDDILRVLPAGGIKVLQ